VKRLTATFKDDAVIDLTALAAVAIDLSIETLSNGVAASAPTRHRSLGGKKAEDFVMAHYAPQATFDLETCTRWLKAEGYKSNTSYTALRRLTESKKIRQLGNRKYQFIAP
jgi:hypothetical protein